LGSHTSQGLPASAARYLVGHAPRHFTIVKTVEAVLPLIFFFSRRQPIRVAVSLMECFPQGLTVSFDLLDALDAFFGLCHEALPLGGGVQRQRVPAA
jgi:hypothetical protein